MLEQLKGFMQEKLEQTMGPNSLGQNETAEAAKDGAGAMMDAINEQGTKGLASLSKLFSGQNDAGADELVGNLKEKLTGILHSKGMALEEAKEEAAKRVPELINGLRDKFTSTADTDRDFDLSNIQDLVGGRASDLLSKAKSLFGK